MAARLLIISMYYWPEETGTAPYVSDLAEHLATRGDAVTVLSGMPHYPAWRVAATYRGRFRMEEEHAGVRIVRRWHMVPQQQSALRRAAYEGSFLLTSGVFRPTPPPDAVIGVVPSLSAGLLARLMAARARAAYGLLIHDLVSAAARQSGIAGGSRAASFVQRAEKWMLARATVVAPVTDAFAPYLSDLGVPPARIEPLPTWPRIAPPFADRAQTRAALGWRADEVVALHAGNMGMKQGLEQVVAAARLADQGRVPVRFVLMGDGNQRAHLEALAAGIERIEFRPFVDHELLPDVLAAADALLVSERPTVVNMSMPSKLNAYLVAGRPIIAAVDPAGPTAREIERAGAGRILTAGQPSTLIDTLIQLRTDPELTDDWEQSARRYAETALNRDGMLKRAEGLVDRIIQRTRAIRGDGR